MAQNGDSSGDWRERRLLVQAMLERHDRDIAEQAVKCAANFSTNAVQARTFERNLSDRFTQLHHELETRVHDLEVIEEERSDLAVADIKGSWEFRAAALTAAVGLIVAIVSFFT